MLEKYFSIANVSLHVQLCIEKATNPWQVSFKIQTNHTGFQFIEIPPSRQDVRASIEYAVKILMEREVMDLANGSFNACTFVI